MTRRGQQITLQPEVLRWARERAGLSPEQLAKKMKVKPERVSEWEITGKISIAQADRLADLRGNAVEWMPEEMGIAL